MIDPSIPPKVHASESTAHGAGKGGKPAAEPGFSDALSDAGQASQQASGGGEEEAGNDTDVRSGDAETEAAAPQDGGRSKKPIIDIRTANIPGLNQGVYRSDHGRSAPANGIDTRHDGKAAEGEKTAAGSRSAAKKAVKGDLEEGTDEVDAGRKGGETVDKVEAKDAATADAPSANGLEEVFTLLATGGEAAGAAASVQGKSGFDGKKRDDEVEDVKSVEVGNDAATSKLDLDSLLTGEPDVAVDAKAADIADDGGASFRFVRADGKGQPLVLQTAEATANDRAAARDDNMATVAVLDSRRFIAPVSTTNAANIAAAMSGDRDWASALQSGADPSAAAQANAGKVMNTLKIQMSPIELGTVTATMRLSGEALSVHLTVENGAAYRKLSEDHSDILKTLRSQGYAIDSIQISIVSTDRSSADNQTSGQQQQQFGQAPQGDGRHGSSGSGRGGDGSSAFSNSFDTQGSHNEDSSPVHTVADNSGNRTGGVYL
ncbi:flagellar hook-length control protein FliK [Pseudomonas sp. R2.Fl]|nr:flagellar hook-length control protein FliK [Pseudomonas sp. R2.Fl]